MTKEREALKLALEALETVRHRIDIYQANVCDDVDDAIAAIREALAQQNQFNPDWDAMAVMVEEQQRMAKRIEELEAHRKPLTDEEIEKIWWETKPYFDKHDFTRAIEAAHDIKGGA